MHKIVIAASAATFMVIFLYVSYILRIGDRKDYSRLMIALLIALPLSPLSFYTLRLPLDHLVRLVIGHESGIYKFISLAYAPLIEEPVKLLPLFFPFLYHRVARENFVSFGMALGVGFGIGKIWLTAFRSSQVPGDLFLPLGYVLLGFVAEWLMICLLHGAFTSFVLSRLHRGFGLALAGAMCLNLLAFLPPNLVEMNALSLNGRMLRAYLPIYLILFFALMIFLLIFLRAGKHGLQQMLSGAKIVCSECGTAYKRSYWMTHLSTKDFEICPHCRNRNSIDFKAKP
ncbi:MAG: hypothetical protein JXB23_11860 [Candidatus Aminicenantes bacterium]|nr:hypothetical protein [Candidatus Aminicenantes bacterium]